MARKSSSQTQYVLAAMLVNPGADYYGLELSKAAGIASGTIYPILARLERQGVIESKWEKVDPGRAGRPARRYYRLTPIGQRVAREEVRASLERLQPNRWESTLAAKGLRPA